MENEGTKPGEQVEQTAAAPEAAKERDDTVSIRKGEYNGLKTQIKKMEKQLEEYTAVRSAEEQEKLKAAQNWDALDKKKTAEMEAIRLELNATKRSVITERARAVLQGAGMNADLTVAGALSQLPSDIELDAIAAWVDELQKAHPADFARPANPIGAPSAGPTGKPTTNDASSLKARVAATRGKGPVAMEAVMREVLAWDAAHPGHHALD